MMNSTTFPNTVQDYAIIVKDGIAVDVKCIYCKTSVEFSQPETSNDPGDVEIKPEHNCKDMPTEEVKVTLAEPILQDAKGIVLDASDFKNTVEVEQPIEETPPASAV